MKAREKQILKDIIRLSDNPDPTELLFNLVEYVETLLDKKDKTLIKMVAMKDLDIKDLKTKSCNNSNCCPLALNVTLKGGIF